MNKLESDEDILKRAVELAGLGGGLDAPNIGGDKNERTDNGSSDFNRIIDAAGKTAFTEDTEPEKPE